MASPYFIQHGLACSGKRLPREAGLSHQSISLLASWAVSARRDHISCCQTSSWTPVAEAVAAASCNEESVVGESGVGREVHKQRDLGRISALTAPITALWATGTAEVNELGRLLDGSHHLCGHSVSAHGSTAAWKCGCIHSGCIDCFKFDRYFNGASVLTFHIMLS